MNYECYNYFKDRLNVVKGLCNLLMNKINSQSLYVTDMRNLDWYYIFRLDSELMTSEDLNGDLFEIYVNTLYISYYENKWPCWVSYSILF